MCRSSRATCSSAIRRKPRRGCRRTGRGSRTSRRTKGRCRCTCARSARTTTGSSPPIRTGRSATRSGRRTAHACSTCRTRTATRTSTFSPRTPRPAGPLPRAPVDLTPYEGVLVQLQSLDLHRPDVMLVAMNKRDPQLFDVYRLDPRTGELTLDTENPGGISAFADDADMVVRAGAIQHPDASSEIVVRDTAAAPWRTLARFDAIDGMPDLAGFTPDGTALLAITSADANAARLVRFDVASGERTDVAGDPEYDVADVVFSPRTKAPVAASVVRERVGWTVLDPDYAADFAALAAQVPGDLGIASTDRDDRVWLVSSAVDNGSRSYWSYDRETRRATKIFAMRPELERYTLAAMTPIRYPARDGLTIHGYLSTPPELPARGPSGGAAGARRPVGARHMGLQPVRAMAHEPRLRRAAAELSRLVGLRQSAPQRRRPRVGRRDAHRSARREGLARGARHRRPGARRDHGRLVRRLRDARRARVRTRRVRVRRRHRRSVEPQHAARVDPAVLGDDARDVHAAHGRQRRVSRRRSRRCSAPTRSARRC